jgi:hypothetical protein
MAIHDKYNQPQDYQLSIDARLDSIWVDIKPYKDLCCFIYAGAHQEYDIRNRTASNILTQLEEEIDSGKRNIFFDCAGEGIPIPHILFVHEIITKAKTRFSDINYFFITGASDGDSAYKKLCADLRIEPLMEIVSCNFFEFHARFYAVYTTEYNPVIRNKDYVCLNRVLRWHRVALLDKLLSENLVTDKCYYSFYNTLEADGGIGAIVNSDIYFYPNIINNIDLVKTLRLNHDPNRINPVDLRLEDLHMHNDTYFSLITETLYYAKPSSDDTVGFQDCIFFSEKIYKPIAALHPFILVARPYSIAKLNERGFRTFHPYINESYDTIEDDEDRLDAIVTEVKRLTSQTPEQWENWCNNIKSIVEHNQRILFNENNGYIINAKDLIGHLVGV